MVKKATLLERVRPTQLDKIQDKLHLEDIKELKERFPDLIPVNCLACDSPDYRPVYERLGYTYNRCNVCESLFISPRLSEDGLLYFFKNAKSMHFRATEFYPAVAKERKQKIFIPRWRLIKKALSDLGVSFPIQNVLEIGASVGFFASVVLEKDEVINFDVIEPSENAVKVLKSLGLRNVYIGMESDYVGKLPPIYDVIFCNGVLEHPFSPSELISNLKDFLRPGGLLVLCSPGGSGLDSLLLQEAQPNAVPPHMQNFISNQGMRLLAERCGFKLVNFQSIGQLDMDILFQYASSSQNPLMNQISTILRNIKLRKDLQKVLQKHHLTGFYLAILSRREARD